MKTYKIKPIVVEAVQWTGYNKDEIKEFCPEAFFNSLHPELKSIMITTSEGTLFAYPGYFIVKKENGEFYPYEEDDFYDLYEEVK